MANATDSILLFSYSMIYRRMVFLFRGRCIFRRIAEMVDGNGVRFPLLRHRAAQVESAEYGSGAARHLVAERVVAWCAPRPARLQPGKVAQRWRAQAHGTFLHVLSSFTVRLSRAHCVLPLVMKSLPPESGFRRVAVISAKNHKRQRRKRQSVTAKREKSQTPKILIAILTLPNLT